MVRRSSAPAALLALLFQGLWLSPASAQAPVETPDVDLLARTIQEEIEAIRWHMGRPPEPRPPVAVRGVAIRENFRQAMTLWRKVNQLGIEVVGGGESPPLVTLPRGAEYGPAEVHLVLTSVLARLGEIREGAEIVGAAPIERAAAPLQRDPASTPSDVFRVIVQSNRQVNRMLERQFQPGDVYQQVQQAIFYAAEILSAVGDSNPIPGAPAYEAGVMPGHVYGRLLLVFDRLAAGFQSLGARMVDWPETAYTVDESLTPSDVFDLATLLLSELEYLHSRTPGARAPLQVAHPGLRWPSDVYQQAGILTDQASRIMSIARSSPELFRGAEP